MSVTSWIWLGAIIVFGLVEAMTAGLVSIWFLLGAIVALVVSVLGGGTVLQIVLFLVVSVLALVATRPLAKKFNHDTVSTNLDQVVGKIAQVTEEIDNKNSLGAVYIAGKTWSARCADDAVIPVGESVVVDHIEGVKLFVRTR